MARKPLSDRKCIGSPACRLKKEQKRGKGGRKGGEEEREMSDLVETLHHHVRHVFVEHGRGDDHLIEGLVVSPKGRVRGFLLAKARGGAKEARKQKRNTVTHCGVCGGWFKQPYLF